MTNKIKIIDDHYGFALEYRWMHWSAYVLIPFTLFWVGFLITWYALGIKEGDTPLIFFFFPIIHVAVGVGLMYYTVCLFLNTTYIRIANNMLTVDHRPLPWWRGKKEFAVRDVEQLFVKEKIGGKGSRTYRLYAKIRNNDLDRSLLTIPNLSSEEALQLEKVLERQLHIKDQPIRGEYASGKLYAPHAIGPRTTHTPMLPSKLQLQHLQVGNFVDYDRTTFEVIYTTQYDWGNGDTDRLLQLYSAHSLERLVFVQQNAGIFTPWIENKLDRIDANTLTFTPAQMPDNLTWENDAYRLIDHSKGIMYRQQDSGGLNTEQWLYRAAHNDQHLRIVKTGDTLNIYTGVREIPGSFENLLAP